MLSSLSASQIEQALSNIPFESPPASDETSKRQGSAPSFRGAFWSFLREHDRLPSPEEFAEHYLSVHQNELLDADEEALAAIKSRAWRAYPSLARKLHFLALARESSLFDSVDADESDRASDIVITYAGRRFAVTCSSKRSRRRKSSGAAAGDSIPIVLPLVSRKAAKAGDFLLYTADDVVRLKEILDEALEQEASPAPDEECPRPERERRRTRPETEDSSDEDANALDHIIDWDSDFTEIEADLAQASSSKRDSSPAAQSRESVSPPPGRGRSEKPPRDEHSTPPVQTPPSDRADAGTAAEISPKRLRILKRIKSVLGR